MENHLDFTKSVWTSNVHPKAYPSLNGDLEVDVAIVGGGITGITAAYLLASQGKTVAVLESHSIAKGSTAYSTGNLYCPVGERLYSIQSKHDSDALRMLVNSRSAAINFIEQKVQQHAIDCDFQRVPWHLFSTSDPNSKDSEVEKEYEAALDARIEPDSRIPANFPYKNVSRITTIKDQAQFNPYAYVVGLAAAIDSPGCRIFENTKVIDVQDGSPCIVKTAGGTVKAKKVIMATHSPKGIYEVHTKMEVYREFAMAVRIRGPLPEAGVYWHVTGSNQFSVRPYSNQDGQYLIALGEPYLVGTKENNQELLKKIESYLRDRFDVEEIVYSWAAQSYKAGDGLAYIGTSPLQTNTYIATGFKADGLTYGTLAAMIITELINDRESDWSKLYNPSRFTPLATAKQFIKENINVATHLMKDYLFYGEVKELTEIAPGEGKLLEIESEKIAAYRDEQNKLHVVSSVCPHMGCIVHFNKTEKSWDCPCHGSRFTVDGEVIEGPSYHDLARPSFPDENKDR